jgi:hypothetical protein|tara:strand:+ start:336 stop:641 length:306 start_codon:yes stop_codon:yes gene_type:complete
VSIYLDPTGQPTFGIAICARCSIKFLLSELSPDPNFPGLMVCEADKDRLDPYLLPPRRPDQIVLPFNRPDKNIDTRPSGVIQEAGDEFIVTEDGNKYLEMN